MDESSCFFLPEDMTIGNVKNCQSEMFKSFNKLPELRIDTSRLKHIDSSGLQLIYYMVKEAEKRELSVQWLNYNELLSKVQQRLGFIHLMDINSFQPVIGDE